MKDTPCCWNWLIHRVNIHPSVSLSANPGFLLYRSSEPVLWSFIPSQVSLHVCPLYTSTCPLGGLCRRPWLRSGWWLQVNAPRYRGVVQSCFISWQSILAPRTSQRNADCSLVEQLAESYIPELFCSHYVAVTKEINHATHTPLSIKSRLLRPFLFGGWWFVRSFLGFPSTIDIDLEAVVEYQVC